VVLNRESRSNFSTVGYPNPEDVRAFALARKLGLEKKAICFLQLIQMLIVSQ
jgi:hypothetical protein